jgi:CSLREA domain-containing protein
MVTLHTSHFQVNSAICASDTENIVFIDMAVEDYSNLANGVLDYTQVFTLESTQNGVEQITEILASCGSNLINIHIVCHGTPGCLQLGSTNLGLDTFDEYSQHLQQWQQIFLASAKSDRPCNLLIYGCNVAAGDAGQEFVAKLHQLTGANIAASRQPIGNAALGGSWELEVRTTDMEVSLAFSEATQQAYAGILTTFTVNDTGDVDDGDPNNDITTLREAINLANATTGEDTITFGGVFTDTTPDVITLTSGQLTIKDNVTILGTGASQMTVSGNNASRVFEISGVGTDAIVDSLTIANGNDGGLLINETTILNLTNSTVSNNTTSQDGGGITNSGILNLTNSTVSNNTTPQNGGGIVNLNSGVLRLNNSTVSGNTAYRDGGGIFNSQYSSVSLNNSSVSNNSTSEGGGGIFNGNILTLNNSTVSDNQASFGGGIANPGYVYSSSSAIVTNSTISGNKAFQDGGGIYHSGGLYGSSSLTLINSTLTNNTSDSDSNGTGDGGGVFNYTQRFFAGNSIIAGNFDKSISNIINPDVTGSFADSGNNLIGNNTGSTGFTTSTLVGTSTSPIDPKLGLLQNNGGVTLTHALLADSPAIDTGNNSLISAATDQRGAEFERISGATVDIGAYEVQSTSPPPANTDTVVTNTNDSGVGSLRQAILNANATAGADTITFVGVFSDTTPDTITLTSGSLSITDDVTILGTGASKLTINGNNTSGVFEISGTGTDVSIDGLQVTNANDVVYGSILLNSNASLSLTNSNVSNNKGAVGGILNRGNLSLTNSTVSGNHGSSLGGGIFNTGNLSLTNSTISNNNATIKYSSAYGGGIFNTGTLSLTNSTVSDNSLYASGFERYSPNPYPTYGGGIYNSGSVSLIDSTVSDSTAQTGSAIYNSGTFSLTNSTVSGNRAYSSGGGIYNSGSLTVSSSTITNNTASDSYRGDADGGGIVNLSDGTVIVENTIIAGNFDKPDTNGQEGFYSNDVSGDFIDTGNNLIGDRTGSTDFTTSTLVGTSANPIDPKLTPLQNNGGTTLTHAFLADSPALNAGANSLITAGVENDQRGIGFDRISEGTVDIGALEFNGINGTNGADSLVGKNYADIINAQPGNDTITGNQGNDVLTGGGGNDTFVYNLGDGVDTISDFGGLGKGSNPSAETIAEIDILKFQGAGLTAQNLLLTQNGNNLEITFEGVTNDKVILQDFALENLDNLWSIGNIIFDGQTTISDSFDVFNADSTQSTIFNKNTFTFLNGLNNNVEGFDNSADIIYGLEGDNRIDGKSGNDSLIGGAGNDSLVGGAGNDSLIGSAGDDILTGSAGNDSLIGGDGDDILIGGDGDDILIGSGNINTLTGGSGHDQFVCQGLNRDTISDFNPSEDKLILTDLFKSRGYSSSNPISDNYLQFVQSGVSTEVQLAIYVGGPFYTFAILDNFTATNLVAGTNVIV